MAYEDRARRKREKNKKSARELSMTMSGFKKGGSAKKKSKFPDHSGDGKITKKDILMAKGIIPKKKKKGKK